jgi:hypothetical protein
MAKQARRSTATKPRKTSSRARGRTAKTNGAKTNGEGTHAKKSRAKTSRAKTSHAKSATRKWSQDVTEHSDALDLRKGVFKLKDPKKIAASLKASSEHSRRRKSSPYRSALSMLIFYMNRGGKNLPVTRRRILQRAKRELRHQFGRA